MTGLLICSHHTLAQAVADTAALVVGERKNVKVLALSKEDNVETFSLKLRETAEAFEDCGGFIVFADMFGGTPCNAALSAFGKDENAGIIAGFNLPVILEAIIRSGSEMRDVIGAIKEKKDGTIVDVKEIFQGKR
ncbi:MAG: PTS sugar transporter subunit IIA [Candidatus Goldiibacteriota bacterium]